MTFCSLNLLASRMHLNLQPVNAAIDLDNQRLQVDGSAFVFDKVLASRFDIGCRGFDRCGKVRAIFFKLVKLTFESKQRFVRPCRFLTACDDHTAAKQHIALVIDENFAFAGALPV